MGIAAPGLILAETRGRRQRGPRPDNPENAAASGPPERPGSAMKVLCKSKIDKFKLAA